MDLKPKVTVFPPLPRYSIRVAIYCRVSTESREQLNSLANQISFLTRYVDRHADWRLIDIYIDIQSGRNTTARPEFERMMNDCTQKKIDQVITKSVSRFGRNTVDTLAAINKLRALGIDVYFEKENIYTLDSKGELLITIMSSLAQEESRSISENVTWGQRKRMADGKISLPYAHFLGYEKGEDGFPMIIESEAKIVRMIYRLFMEGQTPSSIAKHLASHGIPSPAGKKTWQVATVKSILSNEKYKGDALLQKKFTVDFLTKVTKTNEGEVPQYYVQNSHPAIIEPDEFDSVQAEIERRKNLGRPVSSNSPFSAKIVCGECGGYFGAKVWGSNTKYRRVIWRCNEKYEHEKPCQTPHLTEDEIKQKFLVAFNALMGGRDELITNCRLAQTVLCDSKEINTELDELHREIKVVTELSRKAIHDNARVVQSQDEFNERNNGYLDRYRKAMDRVSELEDKKRARKTKNLILDAFIRGIESQPLVIDEFNERIWAVAIDRGMVMIDGELRFRFKDGSVIIG